ncbi:MAG: hypothetical protein HY907_01915 [Deltaproteobacteria bacterium]|nr:hypothetical protein [Deltaproteobacteria bacterium]
MDETTATDNARRPTWIVASMDLRGECPRCGHPVPVNAVVDALDCPTCHARIPLAWSRWRPLVSRIAKRLFAQHAGEDSLRVDLAPLDRAQLSYRWRSVPSCPQCDQRVPATGEQPLQDREQVCCVSCGERMTVREVDRQAAEFHLLAVGEDPDQLPVIKDGPAPPAAAAPVIFACPSCHAGLPVDGSSRSVKCEFCDANVYLPDDLWRRFHPVKTVRRWCLCIDVEPLHREERERQAAAERSRAEDDEREELERREAAQEEARQLRLKQERDQRSFGNRLVLGAACFAASLVLVVVLNLDPLPVWSGRGLFLLEFAALGLSCVATITAFSAVAPARTLRSTGDAPNASAGWPYRLALVLSVLASAEIAAALASSYGAERRQRSAPPSAPQPPAPRPTPARLPPSVDLSSAAVGGQDDEAPPAPVPPPPPPPPVPSHLDLGVRAQNAITAAMPVRLYSFVLQTPTRVKVELGSNDFIHRVEVSRTLDGQDRWIATSDPAAPRVWSIWVSPDALPAGTYLLGVSALPDADGAPGFGGFDLRVFPVADQPPH